MVVAYILRLHVKFGMRFPKFWKNDKDVFNPDATADEIIIFVI